MAGGGVSTAGFGSYVPKPYTVYSTNQAGTPLPNTGITTPTQNSISTLSQPMSNPFINLFNSLFSRIQSYNPMQPLDANTKSQLDALSAAEQGAVNLQGQANRDKLASQLYSQFGQQTPSGPGTVDKNMVTGLADQIGARFEYGQDQLNRQVQADAASRYLDTQKYMGNQLLSALGLEGSTLGTAAGAQNTLLGTQSQTALGFLGLLMPLFQSLFSGIGGFAGASGGGAGVSGGGYGVPGAYGGGSGGSFGGIGQPTGYGAGSYNAFGEWIPAQLTNQVTNQQSSQQLIQSFMQMLIKLFQGGLF